MDFKNKYLYNIRIFIIYLIFSSIINFSVFISLSAKNYDRLLKKKNTEIQKIEKRLNKLQKKRDKLIKTERDILNKIKRLDEEIDLYIELINKLEEKNELLISQIDSLKESYQSKEIEYTDYVRELNKLLLYLYFYSKDKDRLNFYSVFDTTYYREIDRFFIYYNYLYKILKDIVETTHKEKQQLIEKEIILAQKYKQLEETKLEYLQKRQELKLLREKRNQEVKKIKNKRLKLELQLKELQREKKEIENIITILIKQKEKQKKLKSKVKTYSVKLLKGKRFFYPIYKPKIVRRFGRYYDKKYKVKILNKGIDITSKLTKSYKVFAARKGKIVKIGYFKNLKNYIIIEHEDGIYTFYSGLDKILVKENMKVTIKTPIGIMKTKGILHFELRVGRKAIDPIRYLKHRG